MRDMRLPAVLAGLCLLAASAQADAPLQVVTTLSTFADLVSSIGGERVAVSAVASPRFNPHFIEPRPSDVLKVKRADLFVHAGLDLELWRFPLVDAAGNTDVRPGGARELDLSRGVRLLEVPDRPLTRAAGDIHLYGNPHYWLDPDNARVMAATIAEKLAALDPDGAEGYHRRLEEFLRRLDDATARWKAQAAPIRSREVVGYHNDLPYLMAFLGLRVEHFLEPKPGIPPTPKQVKFIEQYVTDKGIGTIVQATYLPAQTAEAVAKRTGMKVVLLCQNVRELPSCADYVAMLDYNVERLVEALRE